MKKEPQNVSDYQTKHIWDPLLQTGILVMTSRPNIYELLSLKHFSPPYKRSCIFKAASPSNNCIL